MGGEKSSVQTMPVTPAPSASQSAADYYKASLQYGKPMAQQEMNIQSQFAPQQTALLSSLYDQYAKAQQQTQQSLYPTQSKIMEAGASDVLSRLQNPNYMSPSEQSAQQAVRGKSVTDLQRAMAEQANRGGNLYGGRTQAAETQSIQDLLNQFQIQDYTNRMQAGAQTQNDLSKYLAIMYPQIAATQPSSQYQYQSAVPDASTLYAAMAQAQQPSYVVNQGSPSPLWGLAGTLGGAALGGWSTNWK
ncbi:MAG: hypothetical protein V1709_08820 [Planctomycetota bacterium]